MFSFSECTKDAHSPQLGLHTSCYHYALLLTPKQTLISLSAQPKLRLPRQPLRLLTARESFFRNEDGTNGSVCKMYGRRARFQSIWKIVYSPCACSSFVCHDQFQFFLHIVIVFSAAAFEDQRVLSPPHNILEDVFASVATSIEF